VTHKFTKVFILAIGALGFSALPALAATCSNGALGGTYTNTDGSTNAFSCTLDGGDVTLSDFRYLTSTGVGADFVQVGVDNPGSDGYGLDFTGAWSATTDPTDVNISFDVTASGGTEISDVYIVMAGDFVTGTGSAVYTETYCEGGPNEPCGLQVETPGAAQTDVITLNTPTTSLAITKDLELLPGTSGTVFDSSFGNQYSTVPEPRAISLVLGLGLLAGFAFFKRRQAVQN
jgi:hypothetical protein